MDAPAGISARAAGGVALLAAFACACAGRTWVNDFPDIAEQARRQPAVFVEQAYAQASDVVGLVGSYHVEISKGLGRRSLDIYVEAQGPALLRVEVLSPTASSEGYLIAGPEEVGLWLAEERRLYRGAADPTSFGRALGIELSAEDAVALLLGYERQAVDADSEWNDQEKRIRVDIGAHTTAWLHPVTLRYDRLLFARSGPTVEATVSDWAQEPATVPRQISLEIPQEGLTIRLNLASAWSPNPDFPPESFQITVPPGTVEVSLDSLAREGGLLRRGLGQ